MVVLGIDPGITNTGFGVVQRTSNRTVALDGGVIVTSADDDLGVRLALIFHRVRDLIESYSPAAVAVEALYFGANVRTASTVGQARGVVTLAAAECNIMSVAYTPQQVKLAVCGSGRAAKDQVQRMVQTLLSLPKPPSPDHAADALAVALCHMNTAPYAKALSTAS